MIIYRFATILKVIAYDYEINSDPYMTLDDVREDNGEICVAIEECIEKCESQGLVVC